MTIGAPKIAGHAAKLAVEWAAARGLDYVCQSIAAGWEDVQGWKRRGGKIHQTLGSVDLLKSPPLGIFQHPGPDALGFPGYHGVGEPKGLFWEHRWVDPAQNDRNTAQTKLGSDGVCV